MKTSPRIAVRSYTMHFGSPPPSTMIWLSLAIYAVLTTLAAIPALSVDHLADRALLALVLVLPATISMRHVMTERSTRWGRFVRFMFWVFVALGIPAAVGGLLLSHSPVSALVDIVSASQGVALGTRFALLLGVACSALQIGLVSVSRRVRQPVVRLINWIWHG
jgi:hypothetical protein